MWELLLRLLGIKSEDGPGVPVKVEEPPVQRGGSPALGRHLLKI